MKSPPGDRWPTPESGQATVELVGLLPLLVAVALSVFCVLAAGRARELAAHAAGAGAVALLQDENAVEAARDAMPGHSSRAARVRVDGRTVTVTLRPELPVAALAERLEVTERAHAGELPR